MSTIFRTHLRITAQLFANSIETLTRTRAMATMKLKIAQSE